MTDLRKFTREHAKMKCYGLGLGLDSFRMIALMENFCKLDVAAPLSACQRRALFLWGFCEDAHVSTVVSIEACCVLLCCCQPASNVPDV